MRNVQYEKIRQFFLTHEKCYQLLKILYQYLPYLIVLLYFAMLIELMIHHDERVLQVVFVCFFLFILGTLLRYGINAKRPYENGIVPLIYKETTGKSFPSRHLISVGVIFSCSIYLNRFIIIVLLLGILIGICRVLAGVHSIVDVIVGFLFGFILGICMFFI